MVNLPELPTLLPPMGARTEPRSRSPTESIVLYLIAATVTTLLVSVVIFMREAHTQRPSRFNQVFRELDKLQDVVIPGAEPVVAKGAKPLLFYNRPPKTGSTTVRVAMKKALDDQGLVSAKCFNMIEWNEMGMRTIINRRNVDFYGCHTRLDKERYLDAASMREGKVVFMTSTRDPSKIIFSAYLQDKRDIDFSKITDKDQIKEEVQKYKAWFKDYPLDALYSYHGADIPLTSCPYDWGHLFAMRRVAERYEVIIDLARPQESAAMVEEVTGLKPDFTMKYNERTANLSSPCMAALAAVDTSHRSCGNNLVHEVLSQQFNIIKDRLMQNRCFEEGDGSWENCDKIMLEKTAIMERTRQDSMKERDRLRKA